MAQQVLVKLIDDIDDTEADETIQFSVDGVTFEIDLNARHAKELRGVFERYVDAGRRIGGRRVGGKPTSSSPATGGGSGSSTSLTQPERNSVRTWAEEQGVKISDRGRIKGEIINAWREAGSPTMR